MLGAGLLARNAAARGLTRQPWVKTSLAPGSKVVTEYLDRAGLTEPLEELGFNLVGYGCTTCIGNSGPLPDEISAAVAEHDLAVCSVLSGNRNFEGRINPDVKINYLASPPLVVAYAHRRHDGHRPRRRPAGGRRRWQRGLPQGHLALVQGDRADRRGGACSRTCSARATARSSTATSAGTASRSRPATASRGTRARPTSSQPPYFEGLPPEPTPVEDVAGARVLAMLGDSVTTDHISPAGSITEDGPAGALPQGARRAEARLQLLRLAPRQPRGDDARHVRQHPPAQPAGARHRGRRDEAPADGEEMSIYDAAMKYAAGGHAAGRPGGQGVRLRLVARLGGQGHEPARRAGGDRRVLRAHPPLEPRRDGRAAAAVPARASRPSRWASRARRSSRSPGWPSRSTPASCRARSPCARATRSSRRACGSTRPRRRSTSATAGSCNTCCAR